MALSVARRSSPIPGIELLRATGSLAALLVDVRLDTWCLFAAALGAWTFADAILPAAAPEYSTAAYWAAAIVAASASIVSVALHEFGHAFAGQQLGLAPRHITLSPFGGATTFEQEPDTATAVCRVALAGPLVNLTVGILATCVHVGLVEMDADRLVSVVAAVVALANLGLALVNLAPLAPLGGGHVVRALLAFTLRRPDLAARVTLNTGVMLRWGLLGLALIASASGDAAIAMWAALGAFAVDDRAAITRSLAIEWRGPRYVRPRRRIKQAAA